jgi:hypothetical protein
LDPADFSTTQIPIRHITVPVSEQRMFADSFLHKLPQIYNNEFLGDHHSTILADRGKFCMNCHNGKQASIFTLVSLQKYSTVWWAQIHVMVMDPDLFKQIQILERTMAVRAMSFQFAVRVVANTARSVNPDFTSTVWMQTEKCVREP